ncbi:MAG TPA: maleylpyruvate isomerase family mycothiol-dependent enzyme [Streptosporangiaceae bacterium]
MTAEFSLDEVTGQIEQVDAATDRLLAGVGKLTEADAARPSLCPGWTAGHVLTHIARNADGLRRGAEGGRRGEPAPMYDSMEARNRDIEAGAGRPMRELAADVTESALALRGTWSAMTAADWAHDMLHPRAGLVPLRDTPDMRLGETLIHHVDLAGDYLPSDWPASFVTDILSSAAGELAGRLPDGTSAGLRATDTGMSVSGGTGAERVIVSGPAWALACWLVGRPGPAVGALSVTGGELPMLKSRP